MRDVIQQEKLSELAIELDGLSGICSGLSPESAAQLESERDALQKLMDIPEAGVFHEEGKGDDSIIDAEVYEITDAALEQAQELTQRQRDCAEAAGMLEQAVKNGQDGFSLDTERQIQIAEHPMHFAIQTLKDMIGEISQAKTSLYNGGIEYRNYRRQAADAAAAMGNTAYAGVVAPIQTVTRDMVESVVKNATAFWMSACQKFHEAGECIKTATFSILRAADIGAEFLTGGLFSKTITETGFWKKHGEKAGARYGMTADEYVKDIKDHAWGWRENSGVSPVDSLVIQTTKTYVTVHNAVAGFCAKRLTNATTFMGELAKGVAGKKLKYEKAAKELGRTEQKMQQEIGALFGMKTYEAREYAPNPEILAQIEALKLLAPTDAGFKILLSEKEKLLASEKKAWDRNEEKIMQTDVQLKSSLIGMAGDELAEIRALHEKAEARCALVEKVFDRLEFGMRCLGNKAASITRESKWKAVVSESGYTVSVEKDAITLE